MFEISTQRLDAAEVNKDWIAFLVLVDQTIQVVAADSLESFSSHSINLFGIKGSFLMHWVSSHSDNLNWKNLVMPYDELSRYLNALGYGVQVWKLFNINLAPANSLSSSRLLCKDRFCFFENHTSVLRCITVVYKVNHSKLEVFQSSGWRIFVREVDDFAESARYQKRKE